MPAVEIGGGQGLLSRACVVGICFVWVVGRGGGGRCSGGPLFGMAGAAPDLCECAVQALELLEEHRKRTAQQPSEAVRPSQIAEYS